MKPMCKSIQTLHDNFILLVKKSIAAMILQNDISKEYGDILTTLILVRAPSVISNYEVSYILFGNRSFLLQILSGGTDFMAASLAPLWG
jgi:hypothetical protein